MATLPANPTELLSGLDAELAANPIALALRDTSTTGETAGRTAEQAQQPTGDGPLLTADDKAVFRETHDLVQRQDQLAASRLALDTHWTITKLGYGLYSELKKEPGKDIYTQGMIYGASAIAMQAVPNKIWDATRKTVSTLLADFPVAACEPDNDSEEAEHACDVAERFLSEDGSEQGTNDYALFHDRVTRAMTCATAYIELWTDPTGGGYVPHQILAHPLATDPANPLVGPDGMPTVDHVLRYVTESGQFTENPAEAAPQWTPKLRASKWGREHVRVYPEHATIEEAEKAIVIGYCTIGEAKRRWKSVGQMGPDQLAALCEWTPERYMELLPPYQRARWRQADGKAKDKVSSSDERLMFYYHLYVRPCPDYRKGADLVVSGANGGIVLEKKLLAKEVPAKEPETPKLQQQSMPPALPALSGPVQDAPMALQQAPDGNVPTPAPRHEVRCREIPLVAVTPIADPDERDPTGRAYVELIAGAAENNAYLAASFSETIDKILHNPHAIPSTSPIEGWQVEEARASGDFLILNTPDDEPKPLTPPALPTAFFPMYELTDEAINSAGSTERAASGAENSKERSGKALQIAVSRNNVSISDMNTAINNAYARYCRIKLELVMSEFTTPQQIAYVGEDGAYKVEKFQGVDFAAVGKTTIKTGTGTLMDPDSKVQYLANLQGAQLLPPEEAIEAARPAFAKRLGLAESPHEQYAERCIDAWLDGPPQGWLEQEQAFQQQLAAWKQKAAAFAKQQLDAGIQPDPTKPPVEAGPVPQAPFNPFEPRPNDDEPLVAAIFVRKLSRVISSAKYGDTQKYPPLWRNKLVEKYRMARQVGQAAQLAAQQQGQPGKPKQPSDSTPPKAPGQETPGKQEVPNQPAAA